MYALGQIVGPTETPIQQRAWLEFANRSPDLIPNERWQRYSPCPHFDAPRLNVFFFWRGGAAGHIDVSSGGFPCPIGVTFCEGVASDLVANFSPVGTQLTKLQETVASFPDRNITIDLSNRSISAEIDHFTCERGGTLQFYVINDDTGGKCEGLCSISIDRIQSVTSIA